MIWLVHTYHKTERRYLGLAVPWGFKSRDAAQWWIEHRADKAWRYESEQIPVYSLKDVQSFTA